jgi:hypothetical protein
MLTLCHTNRGRIACGLGSLLIAVLALACLWCFSPSVTAGDDLPTKSADKAKDAKSVGCPIPPLPPIAVDGPAPPADLPPPRPKSPPDSASLKEPQPPKIAPEVPSLPSASERTAPPPIDLGTKAQTPPPPPMPPILPAAGLATGSTTQVQPAFEGADIRQLVGQLSEIRTERTKLDDRERQTVQTIKRKFQEQKRALDQLERDLRQLGIDCAAAVER